MTRRRGCDGDADDNDGGVCDGEGVAIARRAMATRLTATRATSRRGRGDRGDENDGAEGEEEGGGNIRDEGRRAG